jgi:hypothetical protein
MAYADWKTSQKNTIQNSVTFPSNSSLSCHSNLGTCFIPHSILPLFPHPHTQAFMKEMFWPPRAWTKN